MIGRFITMLAVTILIPCAVLSQGEKVRPGQSAGNTGAPVVLDGRTLFTLHERILSFSPADRAGAISARLRTLIARASSSTGAVTVSDGEAATDIVAGDLVIMSVTDRDASAEGKGRNELAREYASRINLAITEHYREYGTKNLLLGSLYAAIVTAVLLACLVMFARLFPKAYVRIEAWRGTRIRSLRIQSFEILHADRIAGILTWLVKGGRVFLTFALLYIYIPLVLSFFPWTRTMSHSIFEYIMAPFRTIGEAIAAYAPNLFFIAVIVVVTYFVIRFFRLFFAEVEKGSVTFTGFYADWAGPTFKIVRFLIIAFAAVVAFPYLPGSQSPAFKGVSIFLGVLVSLGSTSAVANIVAGVILTYTRAFRIGERVDIGGTMGDVTERNLLVTRIRTIKNVDITIPNSVVLGSQVTNYSSAAGEHGLILHTSVTIGYSAPWRQVHELLITAALATERILAQPAPFVLQTALNDFYVTYELNAYTDQPLGMAVIYSELHQNIQDHFNEAGVEIMSPHYTQIRDGNRTTIPDSYLPGDYVAPALRVTSVAPRPGRDES